MKYSEIYPSASLNRDYPTESGSMVFRAPRRGLCVHCREHTEWVDLFFEANICSEECDREMWRQYENTLFGKGTAGNAFAEANDTK